MHKILVIGDLMIDNYLWGNCERISPEAPVQIINIQHESSVLGGAGNVVNNLVAMGSKVDIISIIGDCENTKILKKMLTNIKVNSQFLVVEKHRITAKKTRIISSHQQVVRFDKEDTKDITLNSEQQILKNYRKIIQQYDCVVLSDYGKGVLTAKLTPQLIKIAKKNKIKVLVDPKGDNYDKYNGAYLLTPNKKEASIATKIDINDEKSLKKAIIQLKNNYDLEVSIITMSEKGIAVFANNLRIHSTKAQDVFDVTGAGDTIIAALAISIASNKNIDKSIDFANTAAGIVVGKIGSATATIDEINQQQNNSLIKNFDEIKHIVKKFKDKKIIFTNGCFDILHIGHIKYLQQAKKFGDILIVGVNTDNSVKKLKGKYRPINPELDRAYSLSALSVVDFVVLFDDKTPLKLIKIIQPDVLVKGDDYKNQSIIGANIAKELKLVDFIKDKSTTAIIKKIQKIK